MNNVIGFVEHEFVFETQNLYSKMLEKQFSFEVVFSRDVVEVNLAIEFDTESFRWAIKIEYVPADALLPSELASVEPRIPDDRPE